MPDQFLDSVKASEFLCISKQRLYDLISRKAVPYYKIGGKLVFSQNELYDWVVSGKAGEVGGKHE